MEVFTLDDVQKELEHIVALNVKVSQTQLDFVRDKPSAVQHMLDCGLTPRRAAKEIIRSVNE